MEYRQGEWEHIHRCVEGHVKARKDIPSSQEPGVNQDPSSSQHSKYFYLNSWTCTESSRFRKKDANHLKL